MNDDVICAIIRKLFSLLPIAISSPPPVYLSQPFSSHHIIGGFVVCVYIFFSFSVCIRRHVCALLLFFSLFTHKPKLDGCL